MRDLVEAFREQRKAGASQTPPTLEERHAAVPMSPTADLTSSGASMTERVDQYPFSAPAMLRQFAAGYLAGAGPEAADVTERIAKFLRVHNAS